MEPHSYFSRNDVHTFAVTVLKGESVKKWFCSQCHQQGKEYFDLVVRNKGKEIWIVCKTCKMGYKPYVFRGIGGREVERKLERR